MEPACLLSATGHPGQLPEPNRSVARAGVLEIEEGYEVSLFANSKLLLSYSPVTVRHR
jgi:hypothetical protein